MTVVMKTKQIAIPNGEVRLILDQVPNRVRVLLQQINNADVFWIGTNESVDETTGFHVPHTSAQADGVLELFTTDKVYCFNDGVGASTIVILEEFEVGPCDPIVKR